MKLVKIRVLQLGTAALLLGGLSGCGNFTQLVNGVPVKKIEDIQKSRDTNSTVYIKGKVATVAPFMGSGAYELQDGSGSIWVITNKTLPDKGDELLIKSQVQYKSIPIGGKDLGEVYVQEQEQVEKKTVNKE
ncbi:hypothetical protein H6F77_24795 [Microcoleus sp. FACHB-831]|uniref:hypothetical protein n=1 Tax=Microcoleus sp. FACHB-831 TaxID=2692827 RepID=UPI0016878BE1|nr:hypothetical protein [Microcoleus sp. FACHB-831]MBD1924263.1 hypothetical protein [Microcoleus sp. FACHB-831]